MRVLVACEFSGTVREAFRQIGHDAWSCDLLPARDASPFHIQGDALEAAASQRWDLLIAHPPCTYLTTAAAWAFGDGPYHQKVRPGTLVGAARRAARAEAVQFVKALAALPIPRKAFENPVGYLASLWRPSDQTIHPWQFGHDASKATCLWLQGLPLLEPTNVLEGGRKARRANQTPSGQNKLGPSKDRWAERSVTYAGIAAAMADQWGNL